MAGHGALHQPVGGQLGQLGTEQVDHEVDRFGALDLHRRDVDLGDLHVEPLADVDPLQPQPQVGVGEAEPELVLGDA